MFADDTEDLTDENEDQQKDDDKHRNQRKGAGILRIEGSSPRRRSSAGSADFRAEYLSPLVSSYLYLLLKRTSIMIEHEYGMKNDVYILVTARMNENRRKSRIKIMREI